MRPVFTVLPLLIAMAACNSTKESPMKVHPLPLKANVRIEEESLRAVLSSGSTLKPSKVLMAARRMSESTTWLGELLDSEFTANGIATWDDEVFVVLSSRTAGERGRVFLPLQSSPSSDDQGEEGAAYLSSEIKATIEVLRNSFDSFDYERRPFQWAGIVAESPKGPVDFERTPEEAARQWADSRVLFMSLGGDTVLLRNDGKVAWHQMETGKVLEAGDFQEAITRYFRAIKAGGEFSSWMDNVPGRD